MCQSNLLFPLPLCLFLFYRGWVRESRYVKICLQRFCDDSLVWNFQGGVGWISWYFSRVPTYPLQGDHEAHIRKRHPIYLYGIFKGVGSISWYFLRFPIDLLLC